MPSTLSLSCSKKLYELLGQTYETKQTSIGLIYDMGIEEPDEIAIPRPDFSETIRLLPRIAEKKGWAPFFAARIASLRVLMQDAKQVETVASHCVELYIHAYTEEEGMEQVSNYLEALL